MHLSDAGLRLIESFEGYGKVLPDGGCVSYRERINGKLDIPTIGFGCTEGVTEGLVWTRGQADAAFRHELHKHERSVERLVTVEMTQHEFDALVSFSFNTGGLAASSILRRLNAEDREGAARAFASWNKFGGKPCKALTARRTREAALFLKPVAGEHGPMPQAADTPRRQIRPHEIAIGAGALIEGAHQLPSPDTILETAQHTADQVTHAKALVGTARDVFPADHVKMFLDPSPMLFVVMGLAVFGGVEGFLWMRRRRTP